MLFFKKYTSRNLPSLHNSLPFTVADYRPPIQLKKNDAKTMPSTCMVRFWSAFGQLSGKFQLIRFCYPKGGGSS